MRPVLRTALSIVVLLMGITLLIGGIVTGKHGATVVGIICAGVSAGQLAKRMKDHTRNVGDSDTARTDM